MTNPASAVGEEITGWARIFQRQPLSVRIVPTRTFNIVQLHRESERISKCLSCSSTREGSTRALSVVVLAVMVERKPIRPGTRGWPMQQSVDP